MASLRMKEPPMGPDEDYMEIQRRMKMGNGMGNGPGAEKLKSASQIEEMKTPDERAEYNDKVMKALGVTSMEEALQIMDSAGIQPEDINELIMSSSSKDQEKPKQVQLTRRQQLGIDPIPPEIQEAQEDMKKLDDLKEWE